MKKLMGIFLGVCLTLACADVVAAQDSKGGPPKVLTIAREFVKPGKTGATHEKSESLFIQAYAKAKWPTHYLGMESLSGRSRALFFTGYASFEAWEKDAMAQQKNEAFSAGFAHASLVDGELLEGFDQSVWTYSEEGSNAGGIEISHMRYFEIERFQIRAGREKEWNDIVKLVKPALIKANPDTHWAMYYGVYGVPALTAIVITPLRSATEIDHAMAQEPKFGAALGDDGMKKLSELSAIAIESS
ncbi:MAG: hypothetical protein WBP79_11075, partial [Candidatus Acidiferrales bacterium]